MDLGIEASIAMLAISFFGAMGTNRNEIELLLKKQEKKGGIQPFSINDFIRYLEETKLLPEADRYRHQIISLVKRMETIGWLGFAGSTGFSFGGERCYHFGKELSTKRRTGMLWFSELLGLRFAVAQLGLAVCHITGRNAKGDIRGGTGVVLPSGHVLTCAHVITDLSTIDPEIQAGYHKMAVLETRVHDSIDVAVITIDSVPLLLPRDIFWDECNPLDEIAIMGFPRVPFSRASGLITQTGEICSSIIDLEGNHLQLFTAVARPGNSGGPVVTKRGTFAGIVARELSFQGESNFPFFAMVPTSEIKIALQQIAPEVILPEDDFQ